MTILIGWEQMNEGIAAMVSSSDEFVAVQDAWRTWFYDEFPNDHDIRVHHRGCGCTRAGPLRMAPLDESGHRFLIESVVLDDGYPVRSISNPDEVATERAEVTTTIQLPPVLMGAMVHAVTTTRRRTLDAI